jgi:hypothetical protein
VIPPERNAAFVAALEEVLTVYHRPYDPRRPVIGMDEQPVQLIKETRLPLPATLGQPLRVDYEYERIGTANIFLFTDGSSRWSIVLLRHNLMKRKRKKDDGARG